MNIEKACAQGIALRNNGRTVKSGHVFGGVMPEVIRQLFPKKNSEEKPSFVERVGVLVGTVLILASFLGNIILGGVVALDHITIQNYREMFQFTTDVIETQKQTIQFGKDAVDSRKQVIKLQTEDLERCDKVSEPPRVN